MTTTPFNDAVEINGSQDITQLQITGFSGQTEPLQTWKDGGGDLARVTADGRLQVGTMDLGTLDAYIEVNKEIASSNPNEPLQGFQSRGSIRKTISTSLAWIVQELELMTGSLISGIHTAVRGRIINQNPGDLSDADLRAADFEALNQAVGTSAVGQMVGVSGQVTNEGVSGTAQLQTAIGVRSQINNGTHGDLQTAIGVEIAISDESTSHQIDEAYGLHIQDVNQGASTNYAIHTGDGPVHLGDYLELEALSSPPTNNPSSGAKFYVKNDNRFYMRNPNGEYVIAPASNADFCARMTLQAGIAVSTTDQTAKSTINLTPYEGKRIILNDGTDDVEYSLENDLSLDVSNTTNYPADTLHDMFLNYNDGDPALASTMWNTSTGNITSSTFATPIVLTLPAGHGLSTDDIIAVRGHDNLAANGIWTISVSGNSITLVGSIGSSSGTYTGTWRKMNVTRATALVAQNGYLAKSGAATYRYVGAFFITGTAGRVEDSEAIRGIWNANKQVGRGMFKTVAADHVYASTTKRAWNADNSIRLQYILGLPQSVWAGIGGACYAVSVGQNSFIGISVDSNNGIDSRFGYAQNYNASIVGGSGSGVKSFAAGYHYLQGIESGAASGNADFVQVQLKAMVWG